MCTECYLALPDKLQPMMHGFKDAVKNAGRGCRIASTKCACYGNLVRHACGCVKLLGRGRGCENQAEFEHVPVANDSGAAAVHGEPAICSAACPARTGIRFYMSHSVCAQLWVQFSAFAVYRKRAKSNGLPDGDDQ